MVSASIDSDASVGRFRQRRIHFGVRQLLFDGTLARRVDESNTVYNREVLQTEPVRFSERSASGF